MQSRYTSRQMIVHWLTALCLAAILALAWVMINAKEDTPFADSLYDWHGSLGIVVLGLTTLRILWRLIDKAPPMPASLAPWERALSAATYGLFYLLLLWMPITGYTAAAAAGYSLKFFDLVTLAPLVPKNDKLNALMHTLHFVYGQWAVYALVVLHVAGVILNVAVRRNGILNRMLPAQVNEASAAGKPPARP
jgi:cytochrome b561